MLVLASQSPRRQELLTQAQIPFLVRSAPVDERILPEESPEAYVQRLATAKAQAVECKSGEVILGADTAVVLKGQIFGKPQDSHDALRILTLLQGRKHEVLTGVCLRTETQTLCNYAASGVWFSAMSDTDLRDYAATDEPLDKAGAYAIQGMASRYIERIDGSYTNIVGLPIALVWQMFSEISF